MIQEKVIPEVEGVIPPDPVSFWPPQPGWYVVMAIILVLLVWIVIKQVQKYKRNAYRRMGLAQLEQLKQQPCSTDNLQQFNNLLKAASIQAYSREKVASLSGNVWYEFLSNSCKKNPFDPEQSKLMADGSYDHSLIEATDAEHWQKLIISGQKWMKNHRS